MMMIEKPMRRIGGIYCTFSKWDRRCLFLKSCMQKKMGSRKVVKEHFGEVPPSVFQGIESLFDLLSKKKNSTLSLTLLRFLGPQLI